MASKIIPFFVLLLLHKVCCCTCTTDKCVLKVLVVVSVQELTAKEFLQDWEKGLEILPAAHVAIKEINDDPTLLPGYQLELAKAVTDGCSSNLVLVELIKSITLEQHHIIGMVGPFCNEANNIIPMVAGHSESTINFLQISPATSPAFQDKSKYPNLYSMLPLSKAVIKAMFEIMETYNWSKLAVLCEDYYCRIAEEFVSAAAMHGIDVLLYGIIYKHVPMLHILKELQYSGAKITLAFLSPEKASDLVCAAYRYGLKWPDYMWIFSDRVMKDFSFTGTTNCNNGEIAKATEGILLLRPQLEPLDPDVVIVSGKTYKEYHSEYLDRFEEMANGTSMILHSNPYANVLYDSIWAHVLAVNYSLPLLQATNAFSTNGFTRVVANQLSRLTFPGTLGLIQFDSSHDRKSLNVIYVKNGVPVLVGTYGPETHNKVIINTSLLGELPNDELERRYLLVPPVITVLLLTMASVCVVFTIAMLLLYIRYRNEPVIKATSRYLSLLILLGSCLMLAGTLTHIVASGVVVSGTARFIVCNSVTWNSTIGLDMALATLLARILRVYHVFTHYGKTGRICSNGVLLTLILLILSAKMIILSLWVVTDGYHVDNLEVYKPDAKPPYYEVVQYCYSKYTGVWLIAVLAFSGILFISLLVLAFKTRKVWKQNFKDTKKVNALIVSMIVSTSFFLPMWWILRLNNGSPIVSKVLLAVGYAVAPMLFQVFLFATKTIPLFVRHMRERLCPQP